VDEKKLTNSEALVYTYLVTKRNLKTSILMMKESSHYLDEDIVLLCEYIYKLNELKKSLEIHAEVQQASFPEFEEFLPLPIQVMTLIADCAEIELEMEPVGNLSVSVH